MAFARRGANWPATSDRLLSDPADVRPRYLVPQVIVIRVVLPEPFPASEPTVRLAEVLRFVLRGTSLTLRRSVPQKLGS